MGRWWGGFFGELGVADPYKTPFSQEQIKTLDEPADPDMTLTSFGKVHCRETKQRELTERERQTERERESDKHRDRETESQRQRQTETEGRFRSILS